MTVRKVIAPSGREIDVEVRVMDTLPPGVRVDGPFFHITSQGMGDMYLLQSRGEYLECMRPERWVNQSKYPFLASSRRGRLRVLDHTAPPGDQNRKIPGIYRTSTLADSKGQSLDIVVQRFGVEYDSSHDSGYVANPPRRELELATKLRTSGYPLIYTPTPLGYYVDPNQNQWIIYTHVQAIDEYEAFKKGMISRQEHMDIIGPNGLRDDELVYHGFYKRDNAFGEALNILVEVEAGPEGKPQVRRREDGSVKLVHIDNEFLEDYAAQRASAEGKTREQVVEEFRQMIDSRPPRQIIWEDDSWRQYTPAPRDWGMIRRGIRERADARAREPLPERQPTPEELEINQRYLESVNTLVVLGMLDYIARQRQSGQQSPQSGQQ